MRKLVGAANRCRERRLELSLLLAEPNVFDAQTDPQGKNAKAQVRQALASACETIDPEKVVLVTLTNGSTAAILLDCERSFALSVAHHAIAELATDTDSGQEIEPATTLSIGVATVSAVPKNFDPIRMVESAARCLSAARACGTSAVKSIEV
jgi:hypothetical protein